MRDSSASGFYALERYIYIYILRSSSSSIQFVSYTYPLERINGTSNACHESNSVKVKTGHDDTSDPRYGAAHSTVLVRYDNAMCDASSCDASLYHLY